MAVRKIEATDTLETGFRAKYNETILEIITSGTITADGKLRLNKFDNSGTIDIPLLGLFYTREQIDAIFSSGAALPNATELARGIIQIVSQEEMDAGIDDAKAITPYKIKNSTLFPFKGPWVQPEDDDYGYLTGNIVTVGNLFYVSEVDANKADPLEDEVSWTQIGPVIDDDVVADDKAWSSQKIKNYIETDAPALADGIITPGEFNINGAYLATFTSQFSYRLNGVVYDPVQATLQLDAPDALYTRIDLIVGDETAHYQKVTGVAGPTYSFPDVPANTLVLAQIYRLPNGTNLIIINNKGGYLPIVGGSLFGRLFIENGNDLIMRAPEGDTEVEGIGRDSGDFVFQWGDGTEWRRIYINHFTGDLTLKEDQDFDKAYVLLNSGNCCEKIEFSGATGVFQIDMTALSSSGAGLTKRNVLYRYPNIRVYSVEDLGGGAIKSTLLPGAGISITELNGLPVTVDIDSVFGDGYILLSN